MDSSGEFFISRDLLDNFNKVIAEYPVLSSEEERKLIQDNRDRPDFVREKLILHNIRFAMNMAQKYHFRAESMDDLVCRAIAGLVDAASDFDFDSETRFCTYAGWKIMHNITPLSNNRISGIVNRMTSAIFDAPVGKDDEKSKTLGEFFSEGESAGMDPTYQMSDPQRHFQEEAAERDWKDLTAFVSSVMQNLGEFNVDKNEVRRHRAIMNLLLQEKTLEDVWIKFGITRERVRQIQDRLRERFIERVKWSKHEQELDFIVRRTKDWQDDTEKVTNDDIADFVRNNNITLTSKEDIQAREDRLRAVFENAVKFTCSKTGGHPYDVVYNTMRKIYVLSVIQKKKVPSVSKTLGIPEPYVRFHRRRIFQIIKDHNLSMTMAERKIALHDHGIQIHFKPWYGGFYSEWSRYYRDKVEIVMTKRELAANIQFGNIYREDGRYKIAQSDTMRTRDTEAASMEKAEFIKASERARKETLEEERREAERKSAYLKVCNAPVKDVDDGPVSSMLSLTPDSLAEYRTPYEQFRLMFFVGAFAEGEDIVLKAKVAMNDSGEPLSEKRIKVGADVAESVADITDVESCEIDLSEELKKRLEAVTDEIVKRERYYKSDAVKEYGAARRAFLAERLKPAIREILEVKSTGIRAAAEAVRGAVVEEYTHSETPQKEENDILEEQF